MSAFTTPETKTGSSVLCLKYTEFAVRCMHKETEQSPGTNFSLKHFSYCRCHWSSRLWCGLAMHCLYWFLNELSNSKTSSTDIATASAISNASKQYAHSAPLLELVNAFLFGKTEQSKLQWKGIDITVASGLSPFTALRYIFGKWRTPQKHLPRLGACTAPVTSLEASVFATRLNAWPGHFLAAVD